MQLVYFGFNTHYGGAQRVTVEMCKHISQKADVHIIEAYGCCQPYADAARNIDCKYHVLLPEAKRTTIGRRGAVVGRTVGIVSAMPRLLRVRSRLASVLNEIEPDVIWLNSLKSLCLLSAARELDGVPVIYYLHGNYRPDQVSLTMRLLFRHIVSHFIAVSTVTKRNVCQLGIDPARIDVIFNPVDVEEVARKASEPLINYLPGTEADIRILLPGTLVPGKGHLCAIRALRCLQDKGRNAVLWLAGDVPSGAGMAYLKMLESEIKRLKLVEKALILGWREDILPIMSKATAVVLPSHTEGMPMTVLEAMAIGRPVVATGVGGITDLINNRQTGLLIDVDDAHGLARAVEQLMDVNFAGQIALRAKNHIQEHCSPKAQWSELFDVMCKLAGI